MEKNRTYPTSAEIDSWLDSIHESASSAVCKVEITEEHGYAHQLGMWHHINNRYVRFSPTGMAPFYGYWQPALSQPAPLVFHTPGYGAEMCAIPEFVAAGFNVLHVSPLGYATPQGPDESKRRGQDWPVLADTVLSKGEKGYRYWLANCTMAITWALHLPEVIPDRLSFIGTSQGGGGALLLGSLFSERGVRCVAADVPFLTDFRTANGRGGYSRAINAIRELGDEDEGWKAVGLVDTTSHVHRLKMPVLLTAAEKDDACPPETIKNLYELLQGTKSLTYLAGMNHWYTKEYLPLAGAWLRLYG